jgi:Uma2 family endonuclease
MAARPEASHLALEFIMALPARADDFRMDYAEYLSWETQQVERWEFWNGEVFAMTGARRVHNIVSGNVFAALREALRGTPCMPFVADMQVRVRASNAGFYPDVVVSCDPRDAAAERTLEHPRVVVEVLSDTTASNDRGEKFRQYRLLPSLQQYLLLDPDLRRAEMFTRGEAGAWVFQDFSEAPSLELCGVFLPLTTIFADLPEHQSDMHPDMQPSPQPDQQPGAAPAAAQTSSPQQR